MDANEIQIGGGHYQKPYQHWDFAVDIEMPYLLGCATKYPTRWRDKNGIEDLRKAVHYLQKADEEEIYIPQPNTMMESIRKFLRIKTGKQIIKSKIDRFCKQLDPVEGEIVAAICHNDFEWATKLLTDLICEVESSHNYIKG